MSLRVRLVCLGLLALALHVCVFEVLGSWQALAHKPPPARMTALFTRPLALATPTVPQALPPPARRPQTSARPHAAAPEPAASEPAEAPLAASAAASSVAVAPDAVPAPAPAASADFEPGPEWPLSTQLDYRLTGHYRGPVTGHAKVQWLRQGRHYQVHLELDIGPSFAPLLSRQMSSDGLLTPQGMAPQRYDEATRVLMTTRARLGVSFEPSIVTLAHGQRLLKPEGVQDSASQFVQLTWLFLTGRVRPEPGLQIDLPLALPYRLYPWRYEVQGLESIDTPMGSVPAWHLRPLTQVQGGDMRAEVWLAPTLQYLPVRLRIQQGQQTYVDMLLKQAPMQASSDP